MPTSLDQVKMEREMKATNGKKYANDDVEMAVRMGVKLLKEGDGLKMIEQTINQSKDPAMVVGQFLAQIMAKLAEQLRDEYSIDPGLFLAKDGWLDFMIDFIEKELGYPEEFSDQIYQQVLEVIKAGAQSPEAPNNVMGGEPPMEGGAPPVDPNAAPPPEPPNPDPGMPAASPGGW